MKKKTITIFFASMLMVITFAVPTATGAGSITLNPTGQAPGELVTVTGTGFRASKNVGIAFGGELNVTGEIVSQLINADKRDYNFTHRPIKPGSIQIIHLNLVTGSAPLVTDNGAGTLYLGSSGNIFSNEMNYAIGNYHREGVFGTNPDEYLLTASYISYQYSLTPFGSITTDAEGKFSVNFTIPSIAGGNYTVTTIDASGNLATATLNVSDVVPEVLPIGSVLLLLAFASIAGSWQFRKRSRQSG